MTENWVEIAQKMAESARAGLAADRKRLQEIIAEQQAKKIELEGPTPISDEESEELLSAIDEGIRDAKAGQTFQPKKSASGCLVDGQRLTLARR